MFRRDYIREVLAVITKEEGNMVKAWPVTSESTHELIVSNLRWPGGPFQVGDWALLRVQTWSDRVLQSTNIEEIMRTCVDKDGVKVSSRFLFSFYIYYSSSLPSFDWCFSVALLTMAHTADSKRSSIPSYPCCSHP